MEDKTALVWMSAGNSHFKKEIIEKIIKFTNSNFSKTIIMSPDEPAEHTFKALGYEGNDVKKKARLNANLLHNRVRKIIESFNELDKNKFHVVEWIKEVIPNKDYQNKLIEIKELYKHNYNFHKDARETTRKVLHYKIKENTDIEKAIDEAVNYLLKELAFILASPTIYKTSKIVYIYHHQWVIYQNLINGKYDGRLRSKFEFMLFK